MIRHMAKQSLKFGKLKNIFVTITIVLSVSLLTVLALFAIGTQTEMKYQVSKLQQVSFYELTDEQIAKLQADKRLEEYMMVKMGETTEADQYMVTPVYYEKNIDEIQTIQLREGNMPQGKNEAVVSAYYLEQIGKEATVGTAFTETFYDGTTEEFIVSGIYDSDANSKQFVLVLSSEYALYGSQLSDIRFEMFAKVVGTVSMGKAECKDYMYRIGTDAGMEYKYINPKNYFLNTLSVDSNQILMVVVIGAVILLACVLVIYGVFYISVVGKIQQFGQLRTIGMSKKQIKRLVSWEGRLLFLRAAPIGLLIGGIAGYLIKPDGWSWINSLVVFAVVLAVNYLIIIFSIRKPAKQAASISPLEALRYMPEDGGNKKAGRNLSRDLSPVNLGMMSFQRNKKKVVTTLLSLGLGGILFMAAAVFITSFNRELYSRQLEFKTAEIAIELSSNAAELDEFGRGGIQANSPLNETFKQEILQIPGVKDIQPIENLGILYDYEKQQIYRESDMIFTYAKDDIAEVSGHLIEGSFDEGKMAMGDYVLVRGNDIVKEIYGWGFEVGDTVKLYLYNGTEQVEKEVTILGFLDSKYKSLQDGWFCMSEETLENIVGYDTFDDKWLISTESEQEAEVAAILEGIVAEEPKLIMNTLQERREIDRASFDKLFATMLGLAIFIMAFSILSMMNTLITNIVTRKQELARLESIGMTGSQISKMLLAEGISLSVINSGLTLVLGTAVGYLLCQLLEQAGITYMKFQFPIWFFLGYVCLIVIVPILVTKISTYNFMKESLVERLREAEC